MPLCKELMNEQMFLDCGELSYLYSVNDVPIFDKIDIAATRQNVWLKVAGRHLLSHKI